MKKVLFFLLSILFTFNALAQKSESKNLRFSFLQKGKYRVTKDLYQVKTRNAAGRTFHLNNVVVPLKNVDPFLSLTIGLEGTNFDHDAVELSYSTDGKNWQIAQHAHDMDGENNKRWTSEILYLDKALTKLSFKIKVKNDKILLKAAGVNFFNPNMPATKNDGGALLLQERGSSNCAIPPSVPRTVWGSSLGLTDNFFGGTPTITTVTHLIVHHSAGTNTSPNWAATVAAIFNFHTTPAPNGSGFSDLGYNYLIAPDGTLFVGRGGGNNVQGAHYCGKNFNTMGVCLIGTYTTTAPPDTMLRTLEKLLAWKAVEVKIAPIGMSQHSTSMINNIDGHRSGCATECPGEQTFALLSTIRTNVDRIVKACAATSIFDNLDKITASIAPNPTEGALTIRFDTPLSIQADLMLSDVTGRVIFHKRINTLQAPASELNLNLPNDIASGLYWLHLKDGKRYFNEKVVVSK